VGRRTAEIALGPTLRENLPTRQVLGFQGLSIGKVLAPPTTRTLLIDLRSRCPTFGLRVFESQSLTEGDFSGFYSGSRAQPRGSPKPATKLKQDLDRQERSPPLDVSNVLSQEKRKSNRSSHSGWPAGLCGGFKRRREYRARLPQAI
jgi:hypothetical protein